jgi:glutaminyl-peptide cyclotransferase
LALDSALGKWPSNPGFEGYVVVSRKVRWSIATVVAASVLGLLGWAELESRRSTEPWRVRVVAAYPHDPSAYTQGLAIHDGRMYEGTGHFGASTVRRVEIETGQVEMSAPLSQAYFGEGITVLYGRLYQLTWQSRIGFVYDLETFKVLQTFRYSGEGWGLTHDGKHLIVSDGSSSIRFLDPETFAVLKRLDVRENDVPVTRLNELEYVDGEIWANVWHEDRIARISAASGEVLGWIDLSGLYPRSARRNNEDVLNGIAFDSATGRVFVTGKNWPQLFAIEIVRP